MLAHPLALLAQTMMRPEQLQYLKSPGFCHSNNTITPFAFVRGQAKSQDY